MGFLAVYNIYMDKKLNLMTLLKYFYLKGWISFLRLEE
jgi:hypothetical protein